MGGRPPKPMAILDLQGTARPDRHAKRANEPSSGGKPEKPPWLKGDGEKFWQWAIGELDRMGVTQSIDTAALAAMCRWWSEWRRSDRQLEQMGMSDVDERARAMRTTSHAWKNFMLIAARFGFTPVDRVRLATPVEVEESDPLLDMLKRRQSAN